MTDEKTPDQVEDSDLEINDDPESEFLDSEPIDENQALIDDLTQERDEARDRWLRSVAEMDNLRKRTRREVSEARHFAVADVVKDLLDILDDLERALGHADSDNGGESILQGLELIENRLRETLGRRGITLIEVESGAEFNPHEHEAVAQIPGGDVPAGAVVEVMQSGYRMGDRVLRVARVVVAE